MRGAASAASPHSLRAGVWFGTAHGDVIATATNADRYRCGPHAMWGGGPGAYLWRGARGRLGLQANCSGEWRDVDVQGGATVADTGRLVVCLGPDLSLVWGNGLSAELGVDLPVFRRADGEQLLPTWRTHAGVAWPGDARHVARGRARAWYVTMPVRPRSLLVQLRATLLAAIAACAIVGLPGLRALHAGAHAVPAVVAAPSAVADATSDHDESTCSLCQTLAAADGPLTPHDAVATTAAIEAAVVVVAVAPDSSAPSHVPVHADARAPPRG